MIDTQFLKDLAERCSSALPASLKELKKEFEEHCYSVLQNAFAKLNLVTREEFDIQKQLLGRLYEEIHTFEEKLATFEMKAEHPLAKKSSDLPPSSSAH